MDSPEDQVEFAARTCSCQAGRTISRPADKNKLWVIGQLALRLEMCSSVPSSGRCRFKCWR